jgi:hypothetical protein
MGLQNKPLMCISCKHQESFNYNYSTGETIVVTLTHYGSHSPRTKPEILMRVRWRQEHSNAFSDSFLRGSDIAMLGQLCEWELGPMLGKGYPGHALYEAVCNNKTTEVYKLVHEHIDKFIGPATGGNVNG